ncbi:MAG: anti-anti-sigma factor [Rhodanobacter sp. 68-29]|nr:sigma-E factor negative regulatory protein [Rhodanobacter sp.]ODU75227.1 MAG: anti-anti-sigma factor [Rhodanobacter sp. SCN 69-32]OJY59600.1 MAG: anti-anti-sigma factor [Rhodanobacter sp. 68-29]
MNQPDQHQHAREHLSAGIDGELSHEELRFLLRRLDHDGELRRTWASYHVARDGLRRQLPPLAEAGFVSRVMLAIEQESVAVAAPRHRWLRWSAGGAIAASVAAAALMVTQPTGDAERHAAPQMAQAAPGMPVRSAPVAAAPQPDVAVVPPWLSGKAPGLLSQRASATLGAPVGGSLSSPYGSRGMSPFRAQRYRTLDNHDGSYLILLDPAQQQVPDAARQGSGSAR